MHPLLCGLTLDPWLSVVWAPPFPKDSGVEHLIPSQWHYWKVVEILRGSRWWEV